MKRFLMVIVAVLSALYIVNPTAGFFEILPDNIPFVGNLDEATATMLLLWALRYFGIDPTKWFQSDEKQLEDGSDS